MGSKKSLWLNVFMSACKLRKTKGYYPFSAVVSSLGIRKFGQKTKQNKPHGFLTCVKMSSVDFLSERGKEATTFKSLKGSGLALLDGVPNGFCNLVCQRQISFTLSLARQPLLGES